MLSHLDVMAPPETRDDTSVKKVVSLHETVGKKPDGVLVASPKVVGAADTSVVLHGVVSGGGIGSSVQVVSHGIVLPFTVMNGYGGDAVTELEGTAPVPRDCVDCTPVPEIEPLVDGTPVVRGKDDALGPLDFCVVAENVTGPPVDVELPLEGTDVEFIGRKPELAEGVSDTGAVRERDVRLLPAVPSVVLPVGPEKILELLVGNGAVGKELSGPVGETSVLAELVPVGPFDAVSLPVGNGAELVRLLLGGRGNPVLAVPGAG